MNVEEAFFVFLQQTVIVFKFPHHHVSVIVGKKVKHLITLFADVPTTQHNRKNYTGHIN